MFFFVEQGEKELFTVGPGGAISLKYGSQEISHLLRFSREWWHEEFPVEEISGGKWLIVED